MIPYFLLIGISFLTYLVCVREDKNGRKELVIGLGKDNEEYGLALPVFFVQYFLLVSLRAKSVGNDTQNYALFFERDGHRALSNIFYNIEESLFSFYNNIIYRHSENFHIYLLITSAITIFPIMYYYCRDRRHSLVKIALFVNMSTFVMMFSGIRQGIAIALGVVAFECMRRNKNILFFVLTTVAVLFHTSGFMILFIYPLYKIRFKKKHLLFIVPLLVLCLIFNNQIFTILGYIMGEVSDRFSFDISPTGAIGSLILFILFSAFVFIIADEKQMDDEAYALRNILLFAVVLQCFAPLNALAMRMNYYFIILIPAVIGKALTIPKKTFLNTAKWGEVVICVYFILSFCLGIYTSFKSGTSPLHTVPYVPFWVN